MLTSQPPSVSEDLFDLTYIYHQVTTHPETDLYPAVSPDGQWVAFASKRNGNMEIWIKSVKGGTAYQITKHQADDIMPAWSPDGENIAFVSYREDALGDIWMVSVKKKRGVFKPRGEPRKITTYLGADLSPCFSPNGRYLAFSSDRYGTHNIFVYQFKKKKLFRLTRIKSISPAWSGQGNRIAYIAFNEVTSNGQLFCLELDFDKDVPHVRMNVPVTSGIADVAFPSWNPNAGEILFTRYDRDTNHDGKIDPDNQPSLWKINVDMIISDKQITTNLATNADRLLNTKDVETRIAFQEVKLLPNFHYDYQPVCSIDSVVYFNSRRSKNDDIWSLPINGPIPKQKTAFLQYEFALSYFDLPNQDLVFDSDSLNIDQTKLENRIFAFNRVFDFFPNDTYWAGWALYQIARTHAKLKQTEIAAAYFDEILSHYSNDEELIKETKISMFKLKFEVNNEKQDEYVEELEKIINNSPRHQRIQAQARFLIAESYFLHRNYSQAINEIKKFNIEYPESKETGAKAHLLMGDIYAIFGQKEEIVNAYLQVIKKYPQQTRWVNAAMERILSIGNRDSFENTVTSYRNIIAQYADYERLAAWAQLKLGELFFTHNDYNAAIDELLAVTQNYPEKTEISALAELKLGEVFQKKEDDLRSIRHYKKVMENYNHVQSGLYSVEAQERLIETYIKIASRYRRADEITASRFHYRNAIELDPRNIEAHRGLIATMYAQNNISEAVKMYQSLKERNPKDEILLYMLGLCYSYKATERSDRTKNLLNFDLDMMKKSNTLIESALSKNYRIVQAYLTLSFNYQMIEQYQNVLRNKEHGFFTKAFNTVTAPIQTVFNWATMQKEEKPEQWYEKAIEVLTTAVALNDENENPLLESELALNLAANYFNLKEFGFERAYYYYQMKLKYDSTFKDLASKAEFYKRMGRCALVAEDFTQGPAHFKTAINLYNQLGDKENWVLCVKWLALLYQLAGEYDESVMYLQMAAEYDKTKKRYNELEIDYRSIAYNYSLLNDHDEAIRYAEKALDLIQSDRVKKVEAEPNWIKIGILGIEFPVWNLGEIGAGSSTAAGGFTTQEEIALLYSIMGQSVLNKRSIPEAISYLQKRINIYRKRKDKTAEAIFLNNIGYLYYLDFDYSRAWSFFEQSYKICQKEQNLPGMLINTINLGSISVLTTKLHLLKTAELSKRPQYNLETKSLDNSEKSFQYLHHALAFYDTGLLGFSRERIQIYNLLGSLHVLFSEDKYDSLGSKGDREEQIRIQFDNLEKWAIADSCFNEALKLSRNNKYFIEEIMNQRNLAYLSSRLGEGDDAIQRLIQARKTALSNNYSSLLWQIDFDLALLLSQYKVDAGKKTANQDVGFYLNEAVKSLEKSSEHLKTFRATPLYRHNVRKLYETAVQYFVENKLPLTGLRFTEKYRGKEYLDTIGSHKLSLKKERHKIFLGNAHFLKNEIASLEANLREAALKNDQNKADVMMWDRQKRRYESEYQQLLEDLKSEDPELESFITTEPVTYPQIQKILYDGSIVVDYFITNSMLYIWTISSDSVTIFQKPIDHAQLTMHINDWIQALSEDSCALIENKSESVWQNLIEPIADNIRPFNTIIIIPDGILAKVPFSYLINFSKSSGNDEIKMITLSPSLSNYYFSFYRRKISGKKLFLASSDLTSDDYEFEYIDMNPAHEIKEKTRTKEDFFTMVSRPDIVFLNVEFTQKNFDPLISYLQVKEFENLEPLQIKDIYALDLNPYLVLVDGTANLDSYAGTALERILLYAGSPSLVMSMKQSGGHGFRQMLFEELQNHTVAEAFMLAQRKMQQKCYAPVEYAFYQLIGFQGMTHEQEEIYANERLFSTVAVANQYYEEGSWKDAMNNYEKALKMAKKQRNSDAIENLYQLILDCAANGRYYDTAIYYQKELIELAEKNDDLSAFAQGLNYLVYFYTQKRDFDNAVKYQTQYLNLVKKYELKEEIANSYRHLGLVYERDGNKEKALACFTKAISVFREVGDSLNVADVLKDRGRIYLLKFDNYSKALDDQEGALAIYNQQNETERAIEVLQNIGLSHERLANYQTALEYQQNALNMSMNFGNERWIGISKQYLANVNWKTGNFEIALQYQREALNVFENLGETKLLSVGFATQGLISLSLGDPGEALILERKALELAETINDFQDMATIHKNISLIYRSKKQWKDALSHVEQALQYDQKVGSKRGLSYDFRELGIIKFQLGLNAEGFQNLRRALSLSKEIYDGRNISQCYYEIGRAHYLSQNIPAALDTLSLTMELADKLFIPDVQWRAHRITGKIYQQQGKLEAALNAFNRALEVVEDMRSQIKVEEYKSGFIDNKLDVYYDLVNLYLTLDFPEKALAIVERAKSRNFIEMIANRDIEFSGSFSNESLEQRKKMEQKISRVQNEISSIKVKQDQITAPEKARHVQLKEKLAALRTEYQALITRLKEQNPELAQMVSVEPLQVSSLQRDLPDSTMILEYFYTKDRLIVWAIKKESVLAKSRIIDEDQVFSLVDSLREQIKKQYSTDKTARSLYEILCKPVESAMKDVKHLVIIPHGVLHYLPFAALISDENMFLIEKYSLSISPSSMVLNICLEKGERFLRRDKFESRILAFGNPELGDPRFDLPFAEKEIESIQLLYSDVETFIGENATETNLKKLGGGSNMILLSCHGEFESSNPLFSALLLSPDFQNDGRLEAHEIFGLNLNAYLVAMSACETGLSKVGVGDELVGLNRSFIYAGASSLLSSLWKVDDLTTAIMIKRYFRYLKEGASRSAALQKAVVFVKEKINVHPYYWSAFNIIGDFR